MNPSVSVVIPTYNGASLIGETLSAVFVQTHPPDEILIVDDCSTDLIESVIASIARQSPTPIRFSRLQQNTGGPSKPLNVGISKAKGEFILTLDQDDLMRPQRIEASLKALLTFPNSGLAIGRFAVLGFEDGDMAQIWPTSQFSDISDYIDPTTELSLLDSKVAFAALLQKNFAGSASNFCFMKPLWEKIGGFDESVKTCSDLDFILRAVLESPVAIINEVLFDYRWRDSSLNHANARKTDLELTKVRLLAAFNKPEWAAEQRLLLEDCAIHAAKMALQHGDLSGTVSMLGALMKNGEFGTLLKRKFGRTKNTQPIRDAP